MDLKDIIFAGIVEDNVDPRRQGRIKVRVQCIFDDIPNEHLPWCSPYIIPAGTSFCVPPIGKMVNIIFDNGQLYSPYYFFTDKYNLNLQDKLETLSDEDYANFNSITFNHMTQIYADNNGLTMDYLINKIKINNDNINLELKDNKRKINLGTAKADQNAVLGEHFILDWFTRFLTELQNPLSLVGNSGAPIQKTKLDELINEFLNIKKPDYYVSKNVFIVDNDKVKKLERDSLTNEVEHDDMTIISMKQSSGQSGQGINVESSLDIDEDSRNAIIKKQEKDREILKMALPEDTSASNINSKGSPKKDRKNKPKMSKYSADNRERVDRLNSSIVASRKAGDGVKINNPNYGPYAKL